MGRHSDSEMHKINMAWVGEKLGVTAAWRRKKKRERGGEKRREETEE